MLTSPMALDDHFQLSGGTAAEISEGIFAAAFPGGTVGDDMAASRARSLLEALLSRLVELRSAGQPLVLEAIHDGLSLIGQPGRPGYLDLAFEGRAPGTPAQQAMREALSGLPRAVDAWGPEDHEVPLVFQERFGLSVMSFRSTLGALLLSAGPHPS